MFEHPDPRCGQCEHLVGESCLPAAEALRRLGYPAAEVRPAPGARALVCPDFRPGREAELECAEETGYGRLRLAAARARGLMPR